MGNTQHSLLSGNFTKALTERGKSQSPFTGQRSLILQKNQNDFDDQPFYTSNERISNKDNKILQKEGIVPVTKVNKHVRPFTPSRKQILMVEQNKYQENQKQETKVSESLRNMLKNSIFSSQMTPQKELHNKSPMFKVNTDFNNAINVNQFENKTPRETTNQSNNSNSGIKNYASTAVRPPSSMLQKGGHPVTTRPGSKRFTFDPYEISSKKSQQKSQDYGAMGQNEESNSSSPDDCDTKVQVYYDTQKQILTTSFNIRYVTVKWNSKHKNLTCGWLISEVMRHLLFEDEFNKKTHIIGMKNMNYKASEVYDYLLTQLESTLHFIKDGDNLQIISITLFDNYIAPPEKYLVGSMTSANSNFSPVFSEPNPIISPQQVSLEDFEFIKVIGKGGFSKVFQVRKKDTGKIYAMKTLSKAKIKRDNKVENILNERSILEKVSHPFIIQMKYAFQNVTQNEQMVQEDYLFLILEFCAGGELFYRLNNIPQGRMTENQAKFYFAEILEAIQYLHDNDILYRDLKPENIVLDENGHLKITDFGLSKLNFKMGDRAYSFCGSPEYMAPEMLITEKNRMLGSAPMHHDKSLDFYHLGALLYEILCGLPPFFSEDRQKMYKDIVFSPIQFPSFLSTDCKSLLKGLIQKNPQKRLGAHRGAIEIKEHPWCQDIDWAKVLRKEIVPPFKPFITKSNFDPEYTSMNPILEDEDVLVPLDEIKDRQPGEFLNDYENRIAKQKQNQLQEQKLIRQHSIELYARENNTFRGYSFLNDNNQYGNQQTQNAFQDQEGFYFCLADKEESFTGFGSPVNEFDCLSDGGIINFNHQNPQNQAMNIDQEMVAMFQNQSKNQQSQQSILSEGVEVMKANMNMITHQDGQNNANQKGTNMKHQMQNYMSKDEGKILIQQQSKESLYNELLSTFDYSMAKKEKEMIKKSSVNNNQTLSTMSLFSNPQVNQANLDRSIFKHQKIFKESKFRDEKLSTSSLKEKLEFQKIGRKYSPEIDLSRALLQSKQRINDSSQQQMSTKTNITNQKKAQHTQSIINQNTQSEVSSTRGNSNNTKNTNAKKTNPLYNSDYNPFGNTKTAKMGIKKRGSELNYNRAVSPQQKLQSKSSVFQKQSLPKNHYSSVLKPSSQSIGQSQQLNQSQNFQTNMKTSQFYSQVQSKVSQKKSKNITQIQDFNGQQIVQQQTKDKIRKQLELDSSQLEELKIDNNYQTLQTNSNNLQENPSGQFIVSKITANDLIGSFIMASSSQRSPKLLINPVGDQTIIDLVGNSSGCSFTAGNEKSFEEVSQEAMAIILNQSNESCCCSDDELTQKIQKTTLNHQVKTINTDNNTQDLKVQETKKYKRNIEYNALSQSINANQNKHKENEIQFKKELEELEEKKMIKSQDYEEDEDHKAVQISQASSEPMITNTNEDVKISKEAMQKKMKSSNASIIDISSAKRSQASLIPLSSFQQSEKKSLVYPSQKFGQLQYKQTIQSPSSQLAHSMLTKTTPISPLRDRAHLVGGSKIKERPNNHLKLQLTEAQQQHNSQSNHNSDTPKNNSGNNRIAKDQTISKIAQTTGKIPKK